MIAIKKILLLALVFTGLNSFAQREASNWYFGRNAGLDFNSGIPTPLLDGQINTIEGCESISDPEGNLLFYTDGITVWNRNHNIMPNGNNLLGSFSSTQSALIVPDIRDANIFYVFTADAVQAYEDDGIGNGLNYSIVNMSLNGGLGDVSQKNTNLLPNSSEKLTAVSKFDGTGFWVITHYMDSFYVFETNASGVNLTPKVSRIGPNMSTFNNIRGAIKSSPNGTKIAIAHTIFEPNLSGALYLYDFNLNNGTLSNEVFLGDSNVFYGVEFSSNSKFLYASGNQITEGPDNTVTSGKIEIFQFDTQETNIASSKELIHRYKFDLLTDLGGSLQIGIDKKIYHSTPNSSLSVIRTPNLKGLDCDFREFFQDLGGQSSTYGLPPFIQSFFESLVLIENFCFGDQTQFTLESPEDIVSVNWNFGDPESGVNNVSTELNPVHIFSSPGVYTVTYTVDFLGRATKVFEEFVEISETPVALEKVTLTQCDNDGLDDGISQFNLTEAVELFNLGNEKLTANFFKTIDDARDNINALNKDNYTNNFNDEIVYARVFENSECFAITEVQLQVKPMSDLGTYATLPICLESITLAAIFEPEQVLEQLLEDFPNSDISLYFNPENALLEFEPIEETIIIGITQAPELFFRIEDENACDYVGKVTFSYLLAPEVEANQIITFCYDDDFVLDAGEGFLEYEWDTGEEDRFKEVEGPGSYSVTVSNGEGCSSEIEFEVQLSDDVSIKDIIVDDFKASNSIAIIPDSQDGFLEYSIDGGLTYFESNTFNNLKPDLYEVIVRKDDCSIDTREVLVGGFPKFFTPNNDGYHDTWKLYFPEEYENAKVEIYDRFGKLLKTFSNSYDSWDGYYNGQRLVPNDYWFVITLESRRVTGHFSLKL